MDVIVYVILLNWSVYTVLYLLAEWPFKDGKLKGRSSHFSLTNYGGPVSQKMQKGVFYVRQYLDEIMFLSLSGYSAYALQYIFEMRTIHAGGPLRKVQVVSFMTNVKMQETEVAAYL